MADEKCPWCGTRATVHPTVDRSAWRWECTNINCDAIGPYRPTRDEAVATMDMVTGPCPICHEQGAPDRPRVVCQCCHEFVDGEREDAIASADASEANVKVSAAAAMNAIQGQKMAEAALSEEHDRRMETVAVLEEERKKHGEHVAIARELLIVSDYIGMKAGLERYKRMRSKFMRSTDRGRKA